LYLYVNDINSLRAQGGDVIISFGGAAGIELGQACTSVAALQAAYQSVVTKYNLTWIDLDIEGASIADTASVNRRNQAIRGLQAANPNLRVSYTLPVNPTGLDGNGPIAARQQTLRQKACARSDIRNRGAVRQSAILRQRIEQRVRIVGPRRNVVGNLGSEDRAHAALGLVERPQRRTRILVLDHVRAASRRSRRSARYRMIVATSTRMPQSPTWPSGRSR